jgi:hypothetical protein
VGIRYVGTRLDVGMIGWWMQFSLYRTAGVSRIVREHTKTSDGEFVFSDAKPIVGIHPLMWVSNYVGIKKYGLRLIRPKHSSSRDRRARVLELEHYS